MTTQTDHAARVVIIPADVWVDGMDEVASNWHHAGFITRRALGNPTIVDMPLSIQALAARCHANSAKWFPTNHTSERSAVTHCTLGLAGEAGEVANKVKKLYGYVDQSVPDELRADIIGELIDTLIYDLVLLDVLGADIPTEVEKVVAKCVARWGAEADRSVRGS